MLPLLVLSALLAQTKDVPADKVPELVKALKSKNQLERLRAAEDLGTLGAAARPARKALCEVLVGGGPVKVRQAAGDALAKIDPRLHGLAVTILVDERIENRLEAIGKAAEYKGLSEPLVPVFLWFKDRFPAHAALAVAAVAAVAQDQHYTPALLAYWLGHDPSPDVRLVSARHLGYVRHAGDGVDALAKSLRGDPIRAVREQAAISLGELGPDAKAALPALKAARQDGCLEVREAALAALARVEGKESR